MTKRLALIAAAALTVAATSFPGSAANAQQVSVHIATPDIGLRIGRPYPIYSPPVYAPPVVVAPAPVYYPVPRYVAPARVFVPAPIVYRAPRYVEYRDGWSHRTYRHPRHHW
jgi:hypothetical protein